MSIPGAKANSGPQGVGEPAQAEFAGAVSGGERCRHPRPERQIVDQHAAAALNEVWQDSVGAMHIPEQIKSFVDYPRVRMKMMANSAAIAVMVQKICTSSS